MNHYLMGQFQFRQVGQGCFYIAAIRSIPNGRLFNFVYDCGTNSNSAYLIREIESYKTSDPIDMVIISHFHADHVNGIPELLKSRRCRRLIIPYYTPLERLILYFQSTESENDDYRRMLKDPFDYFSGTYYDIEEIIVVSNDPDNNEPITAPEISPDNPEGNESNDTMKTEQDTNRFIDDWQVETIRKKLMAILESKEEKENLSKVSVKHLPYRIRSAYWQFIFYCRQTDETKLELLQTLINNYISELSTTTRAAVALTDLFEKKHIQKLRSIYSTVFGTHQLNSTSLCVFHSPLLPRHTSSFLGQIHYDLNLKMGDDKPSGTLLTGDIDLNTEDRLHIFQRYYHHYLPNVAVCQVMHHGSDKNWPFGIKDNKMLDFPIYVINHGLGRKHHPGEAVIEELSFRSRYKNINVNNETTPFYYHVIGTQP